jgi:hypothetical protein
MHGSCSRAAARISSPTRELARLVRLDRKAELGCIGDRVPHAPERDVDRDPPKPVDVQRRAEVRGERRNVRQLDTLHASVATRCADLDDARGRLEPECRLGLLHGNAPRLQ